MSPKGRALPRPSNILDHPAPGKAHCRCQQKIAEAISAGLGADVSRLEQAKRDNLIAKALIYELERPGSGVPALAAALPRWEARARK
jgi:hypothetical protein